MRRWRFHLSICVSIASCQCTIIFAGHCRSFVRSCPNAFRMYSNVDNLVFDYYYYLLRCEIEERRYHTFSLYSHFRALCRRFLSEIVYIENYVSQRKCIATVHRKRCRCDAEEKHIFEHDCLFSFFLFPGHAMTLLHIYTLH